MMSRLASISRARRTGIPTQHQQFLSLLLVFSHLISFSLFGVLAKLSSFAIARRFKPAPFTSWPSLQKTALRVTLLFPDGLYFVDGRLRRRQYFHNLKPEKTMKKKARFHLPQTILICLLLLILPVYATPFVTVYQTQHPTSTIGSNPQTAHARRALGDIINTLGAGGDPTPAAAENEHKPFATHFAFPNADDLTNTRSNTADHGGTSTSTATASMSTHASTVPTTPPPAQGKYSIIGTLPPVPTPTGGNTIMTSWSTTPTYAPAPTDTSSTISSSKDQAIKQWKIIGVAVIAFSTVAAILLLAVFFDQWWHFVRDVFGRGSKNGNGSKGEEELVPDWEKASWEVRFGDDRHRYPSFSSFPSETGVKGKASGEGGWVRPQPRSSPLGRRERSREDLANVCKDADTSSESSIRSTSTTTQTQYAQAPLAIISPPAPISPPSLPAATVTRSRSQRSQRERDPNPFDDPQPQTQPQSQQQLQPPRSPGMRSISARSIGGASIYGGIA